jgi:hypothetical protein
MADDPFRLRVMKALTAALEEVLIANGYKYDLKGAVFRGRITFGDKDPLPMVSILEVPLPLDQVPSPSDGSVAAGGWDLVIQGFVQDDKKHPTDPAHILLADVKKRLALEKRRLVDGSAFGYKQISGMTIGPGTVRPPDENSAKAYFWLSLTLDLAEDLLDPYA